MASREQWWPAANEVGVVGRFEYYDQLNVPASKAADEKKYNKIIVCRTRIAGDPDENFLPVKDHNKQTLIGRFPDAWKAFNGEEIPVNGTPLDELDLSESRILDFRINGINVIEQVAVMSDAICEKVGFGSRKIRAAAQELLAKKKAEADAAVLKAAADLDKPKRKPGRPSKAEVAARQAEANAA